MRVFQNTFNRLDKRLENHGEKTAYIYWKLLKLINIYDEKEHEKLTIIAFLHDIGSYKTEMLSRGEKFEFINTKEHSIYGYLFIKYLSQYSEYAEIILYHHFKGEYSEFIQSKHLRNAKLLNFADKIERIIRIGNNESLKRLLASYKNHEILRINSEEYINIEKVYGIADAVKSGKYKAELYRYFNNIILTKEQLMQFIVMLVFIIDFRSPQTVNHSFSVAIISMELSKLLNVDKAKIKKIGFEAFVHDIGKITTPIHILEKNGPLTIEEMNIMKDHIVESIKIVKSFEIDNVGDILGLHHERLDGSGYPKGLKGSEISFEGSIVMIADLFSALVEKRCYKDEFPKEKVINILRKMVKDNKIDLYITNTLIDNYDYLMNHNNEITKVYNDIFDKINIEYIELIKSEKLDGKI